jgi:DNA repair exonuclease SbcCD nuclease subunit
MKIALITDTHYGARNDSPVFHTYFQNSMNWFHTELELQDIRHVIHLGDLFDRRKYLSFLTAKVCRETFLEPLVERGVETHIIAGNHDHYYRDTHRVNSLVEIVGNRYPKVTVYNEPQTISIDGTYIFLIPWINDANRQMTKNAIDMTNADIAMGHLELAGFEENKGQWSTHGEDKKAYSKFDMVFSGHYHHKSSLGNIHYLGAFLEIYWSDWNDERGFHIFDTETRKTTFHRNPFQVFKMLSYDDVKNTNMLETIKQEDFSAYKDAYVKIICSNKQNPLAFDALLEKLYKVAPADITVLEADLNSQIKENLEAEEVDQKNDTPTILNKYIDGLTLPVDNAEMKKFMQEIYIEAVSQEHVQ